MKHLLFLITFACTLSFSSFAQKITPEKEQKIIELLELTGSGNLGEQYAKQLLATFKKTYDQVDEEIWNSIEKEIHGEDLIKLVVPIYNKYYTMEDLDQIIAFYQSPVGVKMVASMPQIMSESMAAGQEWGKEIAQKILEKLEDKNNYNRD